MPVELGIWRMDDQLQRLTPTKLEAEEKLQAFLARDPTLLGEDLLIIGREVITAQSNRIDLLAMDSDGALVVIELKRDRTPREVVAQILDYGSWVQGLKYDDIVKIYIHYAASIGSDTQFEEAFSQKFGGNPPEDLNETHRLIVVAAALDASTERILDYLSTIYGVPINAVFFQHFEDAGHAYLTRTWLRDPQAVGSTPTTTMRKREPWNGQDFYISLGEGPYRNWDDCVRYGFISGGQGVWYSRTLNTLFPGARVFVCIPGKGYVGVGEVLEPVQAVRDFTVTIEGQDVPILRAPDLKAPKMGENADDPDRSEYLVRVSWIKTRSREQPIWEPGMFANQNTACKLRNKFTLESLYKLFELTD